MKFRTLQSSMTFGFYLSTSIIICQKKRKKFQCEIGKKLNFRFPISQNSPSQFRFHEVKQVDSCNNNNNKKLHLIVVHFGHSLITSHNFLFFSVKFPLLMRVFHSAFYGVRIVCVYAHARAHKVHFNKVNCALFFFSIFYWNVAAKLTQIDRVCAMRIMRYKRQHCNCALAIEE